jgi:hypothetical protein
MCLHLKHVIVGAHHLDPLYSLFERRVGILEGIFIAVRTGTPRDAIGWYGLMCGKVITETD